MSFHILVTSFSMKVKKKSAINSQFPENYLTFNKKLLRCNFKKMFLYFPLKCQIKEGGLVPKTLYRSLEFNEGEESWSSEIYQTTHVSKGSPHEVRDGMSEKIVLIK